MKRYCLKIIYDGTKFFGWQIQRNKRTIQGEIEKAISKVFNCKDRVILYGSGRTDSGVHALGQIAHFDLCTKLNTDTIRKAINSKLKNDCNIVMVKRVNNNFHARFHAISREYVYQCYSGDSLLFRNQSWHVKDINISKLNNNVEFNEWLNSIKNEDPEIKKMRINNYLANLESDSIPGHFHLKGEISDLLHKKIFKNLVKEINKLN